MTEIPEDIGKAWHLNKATCPECGTIVDGASKALGDGEGAPEPGALAICAYCYAVNQYVEGENDDLQLASFDMNELELEQRKEIQALRIWLASRPHPE